MRHQPDVLPEVVEGDAPVLAALAQLDVGVAGQREVQAKVLHRAAVHRQVADLQLALGVRDLKRIKDWFEVGLSSFENWIEEIR